MSRLDQHPRVVKLAHDLGLRGRGNWVSHIREFALRRVATLVSGFPVESLEALRLTIANRLRMKIEFVRTDADLDRIAEEHGRFHPAFGQLLRDEFLSRETEGITLEREDAKPGAFRFLAIIDARGQRAGRAYFTAWHEVTHVLLHPEQLAFPGFRRAPTPAMIEKDPVESVVDVVAGQVSFYEPLFKPTLERVLQSEGALSFGAIETVRALAAPSASLYATATACVHYASAPTLFVSVEMALKKDQARTIASGQQLLEFVKEPRPSLRVTAVVPSEAVSSSQIKIRRNMRVPQHSVLARAHRSASDVTIVGEEDQASWETSTGGPLPSAELRVEAARRGRYVYGLIAPLH
jgi:hypothetical protein